jgi:hypothetical protein
MPRFEPVIGQQPRFALATPHFRFRALATFAGRASLGGDREVALACLVAGRLAAGMLAPFDFPVPGAKARSAAARQWLSVLSLPPAIRTPLGQVADAVASGSPGSAAAAMERLLTVVSGNIDEASAAELRAVATELAPPQI